MLDFWHGVWYNKNVLKGKDKGCEIKAQRGKKKIKRISKKPLTKNLKYDIL